MTLSSALYFHTIHWLCLTKAYFWKSTVPLYRNTSWNYHTSIFIFSQRVGEFWHCITGMTIPQRMHVTPREWQWVLVVAANSLPPISVLNHPINLAFDKGSCDRTSLPAISSPSLLLSGLWGKREKDCAEGVLIYSFNSCQCSSLSLHFKGQMEHAAKKHHHQITLSLLSSLSFSLALSPEFSCLFFIVSLLC